MNKDFHTFQADKSLANAKRVIRHADKISAQCVWGNELAEAQEIVAKARAE